MLLLLLLHLLIFHPLTAKDVRPRKDTQYVIKKIDSCPGVGYFFKKEPSLNTVGNGVCYLCFCQKDNTAICWKRENRRCNVDSYLGSGKRDTRIRRSPGFAEMFFRDAARDFFNKQQQTECKPFESSFSNDCPPTDWCIGCTVCDCDARGRWECHLLSFCPDSKKSKRKGKVRKIVSKKYVPKFKTSVASATTKNPPKRTPPNHSIPPKNTKTPGNTSSKIIKRERPQQRVTTNNTAGQKRAVKKSVPIKHNNSSNPGSLKRKGTIRYKRITKNTDQTKEMIIKKDVGTHKPIDIKTSKHNLEMEIAQTVMKKVMANLRRSINGEMVNISKLINGVRKNPAVKKNVGNLKMPGSKQKTKPKAPNKVKRQLKKPQTKTPPRKHKKMPVKTPVKKTPKKPTKKPLPKKYRRNKRSVVLEEMETLTTTAQVIPADFANRTVLFSLTPATSSLQDPGDAKNCSNCSNNFSQRNTPAKNEYYKYFVGTEEPDDHTDKPVSGKETTKVNVTETVFNLIGTEIIPTVVTAKKTSPYDDDYQKFNLLTALKPDGNDLKFSKWYNLKIYKDTKLKIGLDKRKSFFKLIIPTNRTTSNFNENKNKVHGKDVERTLWKKLFIKKPGLVKLRPLAKCKTAKCIQMENNSSTQIMPHNIGDLQSLLAKLLKEFNVTAVNSPKKRKFSVIRYLRRLFNKIFKRRKSPDRFSKHHIIQTLCQSIGPCKIKIKDKVLLKTKLAELDGETAKILKAIHIIKGLLKLVVIPKTADQDLSMHPHSYMQKLNYILKDSYIKDMSLSETQITQMEYIKKNTQDFIKSVNKFASLLNEIIKLLTKHDNISHKNSIRILRNSKMDRNITKDNPFQDLKSLLIRYNLVQNSFMKQMYEQLNNIENKTNEKPKVSEVKDFNNNVAIESFSRNIIQNLRKLKRLAQTLSYNGRIKRDVPRDDDALEYLLMLMEYLLKQNHPLDAAPVNDGIDLLIEAIKNAPDIKAIKKKVLEYTPATFTDLESTTSSSIYTSVLVITEGSVSNEESVSGSEKVSSEDIPKNKLVDTEDIVRHKIEENKDLVEMIAEEDKDAEETKFQFDRKVDRIDDFTEVPFFNRVEDNIVIDPENAFETSTTPIIEIEIGEKLNKQETVAIKQNFWENNNLDKPMSEPNVEARKFEVFTGDTDEEVVIPGTVTLTVSELPSRLTTDIMTTEGKKTRTKMRHINLESFDSESIDKKSKLEWIEENFGKENEGKEFLDFNASNDTQAAITYTPKTVTSKTTDKVDVSVLTKEVNEEAEKKKKAKLNSEDVMFRKQMDLLNSLDYGTEKTDVEESDSKDGIAEDRYSGDTFSSYFV